MPELDHYPENESHYSCDHCQETGIDIESREYCLHCELGKRRMNLDRLAEPLRHHPFSNAMWVAHHSAMKTERAIAAADLALLKSKLLQAERELAEQHRSEDTILLDWFDQQCTAYGFEGVQEGNEWLMNGPFATLRQALRKCMADDPLNGQKSAAPAEQAQGQQWISVKDRLPETYVYDDKPCRGLHGREIPPAIRSERVLVALNNGAVREDYLDGLQGSAPWWSTHRDSVVAWQPMPAAPSIAQDWQKSETDHG